MQNVGFERMAVGVAEQPIRLGLVEFEFLATQFREFSAGSKRGDGQGRRAPACHYHLQSLGNVGDKPLHHRADSWDGLHHVEVVQHEGRGHLPQAVHLGQESGEDRSFACGFERRLREQCSRSSKKSCVYCLTCGDQVSDEDEAVGVLLVQPVPERPKSRPAKEIRHERRLAEARLGDDVEDTAACGSLQPIEQAVASKRFVGQNRALDLAGPQREAGPRGRYLLGEAVADLGLDGHPQLLHPHPLFAERRGEG